MKQLGKVLTQTSWAKASDTINRNSNTIYEAILQLENATTKHKGYFFSLDTLEARYKTAEIGSIAFVYNQGNDASTPYDIYEYTSSGWLDTEKDGGSVEVDIDGMQDKIYGYTEHHNGEYTEDATISTGEEGQTSHVKVDGKNHQIEMVVHKQDEEGQTTSASMNITEQGVSINGRLLVSDASETADIIAPDQIVLRVGNIGSEDAIVPSVSINGSLNEVRMSSNNDEASISVADDSVVVNAQEIEFHTENREDGAESSIKLSKGDIFFGHESSQVRLKELIPVAVEKFVMEAMQNNGEWDDFMAENPLIYVAE